MILDAQDNNVICKKKNKMKVTSNNIRNRKRSIQNPLGSFHLKANAKKKKEKKESY